jgi:hypothetical protein
MATLNPSLPPTAVPVSARWYEALTRFHDGVTPDDRFAAAAGLGLGPELELATLDAALRAAAQLPAGSAPPSPVSMAC